MSWLISFSSEAEPVRLISAGWLFIEDCAEFLFIVTKAPTVLFGEQRDLHFPLSAPRGPNPRQLRFVYGVVFRRPQLLCDFSRQFFQNTAPPFGSISERGRSRACCVTVQLGPLAVRMPEMSVGSMVLRKRLKFMTFVVKASESYSRSGGQCGTTDSIECETN